MKLIRIMLIAAGFGVAAHSQAQVTTGTTGSANTVISDTMMVPVAVRTAFVTQYPNATQVYWYRYTPGTAKPEPGVWYSTMDASDYYSTFTWNDVDYVAWYDNGAWVRSSARIDNTQLPPNIQNVINQQYPGYIITEVEEEKEKKQTVYEVDLVKGAEKWKLHINSDGSITKKIPRKGAKATATAEMESDFNTRYPGATEVVWSSYVPRDRWDLVATDWDYNMDVRDYEVRYTMDGSEYIAWYDDGRWIRSETLTYDNSKLPATVQSAVNRDYSGYTIKDVDREDRPNQVLYEVELQNTKQKCKLHFKEDGTLAKRKCRNM
jgi:uncharacterized membrane protein YkoI